MKHNFGMHILPLGIMLSILSIAFTDCRRSSEPFYPGEHNIAGVTKCLNEGDLHGADSLTAEMKSEALKSGDSLMWANAMVQQAVNSYYEADVEGLLSATDSAICWLEKQKSSKFNCISLGKAYQVKGAYYDQYDFDSDSLTHYLRLSIVNYENSGSLKELTLAYGNFANAFRMASQLDSAAIYYLRSITIGDSLRLDKLKMSALYSGLAAVFTDMRDFDNSGKWWAKTMEGIDELGPIDQFQTLSGLGNDLYYRKDYEGSKGVFLKLLSILDSIPGSRWNRMFVNVNLADTYLRLGKSEEAKPLLDTTLNYFRHEQPNPVALSYLHSLLIRAALLDKDYQRAVTIVDAHPLSDTLRLEQMLARLEVMEDYFNAIGDNKQAYLTHIKHDGLKDSLRSNQLKQQISAMNAVYQRDNRILTLTADNNSKRARIYRLLALVTVILFISAGLGLAVVLIRQRSRKREERMMDKIVALRRENLRNRVTPHFIYNALNQELNGVAKGMPSKLDALVRLIRRQQFIASDLLIPLSEELGFTNDYVEIASGSVQGPFEYECKLPSALDIEKLLFPSMVLQILVENAFKHGFPTLERGELRRLVIEVREMETGRIEVSVFNNSGNVENTADSTGTGLKVVMETLRMINERNEQQTSFTINPDYTYGGATGCKATVILPTSLLPCTTTQKKR